MSAAWTSGSVQCCPPSYPHPPSTRAIPCRCAARRGRGIANRDLRIGSREIARTSTSRTRVSCGDSAPASARSRICRSRRNIRGRRVLAATSRNSETGTRVAFKSASTRISPVQTAVAGRCQRRCAGRCALTPRQPAPRRQRCCPCARRCRRCRVGADELRPGHRQEPICRPSRAAAERPATVAVLPDHIQAATATVRGRQLEPRGADTFRYTFAYRWASSRRVTAPSAERLGGDEQLPDPAIVGETARSRYSPC